MIFEIIYFFLYWLLLAVIIGKAPFFRISGLPRMFMLSIWLVKGVFAFLYCEYRGGIDTSAYFGNGKLISGLLFTHPTHFFELVFFPSARSTVPEHLAAYVKEMGYWHNSQTYFMVRVHALLNLITFESFHRNALLISFLSFTGITGIANVIKKTYYEIEGWKLLPLFVLPTVLFWSSGGHKDGWILFAFGFACWLFFKWTRKPVNIHLLFLSGLLVLTIMLVRQYVVFFLAPFFISWLCIVFSPSRLSLKMLVIWIGWFVIMAFVRIPVLGMTYLEAIRDKYEQFKALAMGNTHIQLRDFEIGFIDIVSGIPVSLYNVIIRPVTLVSHGAFQIFAGIESILLLMFIIFSIPFLNFKQKYPLVLNFFILSILLFLLIGFIVPNLGAQSRYRIFSLPIFMLFFTIFFDKKQFKKNSIWIKSKL